MKTTLVAVLAFLPCVALADSSPTSPPTTAANSTLPNPTQELKVMTQRLNLSPSQQDAIAPILVAEADKTKSIQNDTSLSDQQKHDQIGANHRAALQQIKAQFTPEQIAQIEQGQNHPSPGPTHPSTSPTTSSTTE